MEGNSGGEGESVKANVRGFIDQIFIPRMDFFLNNSTDTLRLGQRGSEVQEEFVLTGKRLYDYLREGNSIVTTRLIEPLFINTPYVLEVILGVSNWMSAIDNYHLQTIQIAGISAYLTGTVILHNKSGENELASVIVRQIGLEMNVHEVERILVDERSFVGRITKFVDLLFGVRNYEIMKILRASPKVMLDLCSVYETRRIHEFAKWQAVMSEILGDYENVEISSDSRIRKLIETVARVKEIYNSSDYSSGVKSKQISARRGISNVIASYFAEQEISKSLSKHGIVSSVNTIASLISESWKLSSSTDITRDESEAVSQIQHDLARMVDDTRKWPLGSIFTNLEYNLGGLRLLLKEEYNIAIDDSIKRSKYVSSYPEAWQSAVIMKGMIYEMCFATTYELPYAPEVYKFSLNNIVHLLYPDQSSTFLRRSSQLSIVREFRPDFFIPYERIRLEPEQPKRYGYGLTSITQEFYGSDPSGVPEDGSLGNPIFEWLKNSPSLNWNIQKIIKEVEAAGGRKHKVLSRTVGGNGKDLAHLDDDEPHLLIIEVGYQTNSERKTVIDIDRWTSAANILAASGISCTVISLSESTAEMKHNSWLRPDLAKIVHKAVGALFSQLITGMPPNLSNNLIGELTSQELRLLTTDNKVKNCPIVKGDLVECHMENKSRVFVRPGGTVLPRAIQKKFTKSIVTGSLIKEGDAHLVRDHLLRNASSIINSVDESNLRLNRVTDASGAQFFLGYLRAELKSTVERTGICQELKLLAVAIMKEEKTLQSVIDEGSRTDIKRVVYNCLAKTAQFFSKKARHNIGCTSNCSLVNSKPCVVPQLWRLFSLSSSYQLQLMGASSSREKGEKYYSPLDKSCSLTLPGRNAKQKQVKAEIRYTLETLSSCMKKGFLRTESGQILSSHKEILIKSGCLSPIKTSVESGFTAEEQDLQESKPTVHLLASERKAISVKRSLLEKLDKVIKASDCLTGEAMQILRELRQDIRDTRVTDEQTGEDFIGQLDVSSVIYGDDLMCSLYQLLFDSVHIDPIKLMLNTREKKAEEMKLKTVTDTEYPLLPDNMLEDHLSICESLTGLLKTETHPQPVPEVILDHVRENLAPTSPAGHAWSVAQKAINVLMATRLGKALRVYALICQAFLVAVSEMTSSGIKVVKVRDVSCNLMVKVSSNKSTNSPCILLHEDMSSISNRFYMNRSTATLGQSLMACVLTNFVQTVQTLSCTDILMRPLADILAKLEGMLNRDSEKMSEVLSQVVKEGYLASSLANLYGFDVMPWEIQKTGNEEERQLETISKHIVCLCYVIIPGVIRNSRKDNKVLQMIRHPYMLSLSDYGFPSEVGTKLSGSMRNTCSLILSRFLSFVCALNLEVADKKLRDWMVSGRRPTEDTISISLFPLTCSSDRQFSSDMYFCHWYNKEMDDFAEGSIRVANEAFEKVMDWESKVEEETQGLVRSKQRLSRTKDAKGRSVYKRQVADHIMHLCCLLGIKNLNTSGVDSRLLLDPVSTKRQVLGDSKVETVRFRSNHAAKSTESAHNGEDSQYQNLKGETQDPNLVRSKVRTNENPVELAGTSREKYSSDIRKLSKARKKSLWAQGASPKRVVSHKGRISFKGQGEGDNNNQLENSLESNSEEESVPESTDSSLAHTSEAGAGTLSERSNVLSYDSSSVSISSLKTIREFDLSIRPEDIKQLTYHTVSLDYILNAVKYVSRSQFPYSCGVPEVVQAFAEISRELYTEINIYKSLKSKDNNEQISSISETTSILASSLHKIDMKSYFRTVITKNSVKLAKVLSKSTRNSSTTVERSRSFHKLLERLIISPIEEEDDRVNSVIEAIKELKVHSKLTWRDATKIRLETIFLTDDASIIFRSTKTLWRDCKKVCSDDYKVSRDKIKRMMTSILEIQTNSAKQGFISRTESKQLLTSVRESMTRSHEKILKMILEQISKLDEFKGQAIKSEQGVSYPVQLVEEVIEFGELLRESYLLIVEHDEFIKRFPDAADNERVQQISSIEQRIMTRSSDAIKSLIFIALGVTMYNSFTVGANEVSKYLLSANKLVLSNAVAETDSNLFESGESVKSVFADAYSGDLAKEMVIGLYDSSESDGFIVKCLEDMTGGIVGREVADLMLSFCIKIYLGIRHPLTSQITTSFKKVTSASELTRAVQEVVAKLHGPDLYLDFLTTVTDTVTGSLVVVRRILGRSSKGVSLPKSVRSKVIYQMYELSVLLKTTSVQEMAFQLSLDKDHIFYGGLAPKAQIGGDRDLIVQEKKTKVVVHANEMLCKSLMAESVTNDGLTNPRLKEEILSRSTDEMIKAKKSHGEEIGPGRKLFYRSWFVIGDCSKWGPIHVTSYFSLVMQQILRSVEGWCFYSMLIHYKSLFKEIEIPIASIEKIINSLLSDRTFRSEAMPKFEQNSVEEFAGIVASHVSRIWSSNKIVRETVKSHLAKGEAAVRSYSHMGQGIHHRQSSLLASVCHNVIDKILAIYISEELSPLTCGIDHAGSSDDFAKIITIQGVVTETEMIQLESNARSVVQSALKLMMGLMRSCQMMVSVKSCVSRFAAEFYSEFNYMGSVSPPTLKFISNQLINHSVSTPNTLHQGTLVESQQAMYMGIPMSTNITFCIFKQSLFIENSISLYKRWGKMLFQTFPSTGRLFLPSLARLVSGSSSQDELQIILVSCEKIKQMIMNHLDAVKSHTSESSSMSDEDHRFNSQMSGDETDASMKSSSIYSEIESQVSSDRVNVHRFISHTTNDTDRSTTTESENNNYDTFVNDDGSSVFNLIFWKYYRNNSPRKEGVGSNDKFQKMLDMSDTGTSLLDPFIQILPESVIYQVEKLREIKSKIELTRSQLDLEQKSLQYQIASALISSSVITDDYKTEISRLMQALHSKHIIRGLSGGMREISLPINRQLLRGYFFHNKTPLSGLQHWVLRDNSKYLSGNSRSVEGKFRVKFPDFISRVDEVRLIELVEFEEICRLSGNDPGTLAPGCYKDPKLSIHSIPVELVQVERDLLSALTDELILEAGSYLVVNLRGLTEFMELINSVKMEIINDVYFELSGLEKREVSGVNPVKSEEIKKMSVFGSGERKKLNNKVSILIAAHLDMNAIIKLNPRGLDVSHLNSDLSTLLNQNPFLKNWLDRHLLMLQAKDGRSPDQNDSQDGSEESTDLGLSVEQVTSELLTYCRLIEQSYSKSLKIFMFQPNDINDVITDYALLVQRSMVENSFLLLDAGRVPRVQDSQLYSVLGVVSVISWADVSEETKFLQLKQFFQMPMGLVFKAAEELSSTCRWSEFLEGSPLADSQQTFGDFLISRSQYYRSFRSRSKESAIQELVQTVTGQTAFVAESPLSNERPEVTVMGSEENKKFTFSVTGGTASGLITKSRVFLVINGNVSYMLAQLERFILDEVGQPSIRTDPSVLRAQFFSLLPNFSDSGTQNLDSCRFVYLTQRSVYKVYKNFEIIPESIRSEVKVVSVTAMMQAPKSSTIRTDRTSVDIRFFRNRIEVGVSTIASELILPTSWKSLNVEVEKLFGKDIGDTLNRRTRNPKVWSVKATFKIEESVGKESMSLYHFVVLHAKEILSAQMDRLNPAGARLLAKVGNSAEAGVPVNDHNLVISYDELEKRLNPKGLILPENTEELVFKLLDRIDSSSSLVIPLHYVLDIVGLSSENLTYQGFTDRNLSDTARWHTLLSTPGEAKHAEFFLQSFRKLSSFEFTSMTSAIGFSCQLSTMVEWKITQMTNLIGSYSEEWNTLKQSLLLSAGLIESCCLRQLGFIRSMSGRLLSVFFKLKGQVSVIGPDRCTVTVKREKGSLELTLTWTLLQKAGKPGPNEAAELMKRTLGKLAEKLRNLRGTSIRKSKAMLYSQAPKAHLTINMFEALRSSEASELTRWLSDRFRVGHFAYSLLDKMFSILISMIWTEASDKEKLPSFIRALIDDEIAGVQEELVDLPQEDDDDTSFSEAVLRQLQAEFEAGEPPEELGLWRVDEEEIDYGETDDIY